MTITAPADSGFNRVAWDLRYPAVQAWQPEAERPSSPPLGVLAAPGNYTVSMHARVDGVIRDLDQVQPIEVVSIRPEPVLPGASQEERVAFGQQVDELIRANDGTQKAIDRLSAELDAIKETLASSTADPALYTTADSIQERLHAERDRLTSNTARGIFKDWDEVALSDRLSHARYSAQANAYGPTPAQRESFAIGQRLYADISGKLDQLIDVEYAALKRALDAASVPWTPGRGVQ